MSRYETLENTLVALFAGTGAAFTVFDTAPLPDFEIEYRPQQPRPQVYVSYDSSEFTDSETLSKITQEEKLYIGFEIHSKTRRGDKGVFSIFEEICKRVLGLKLMGYDKFSLIKAGPLTGSGANHWVFYAQFTTTAHITDQQPDPDTTGPLLKDPQFILEV